MPNQETDTGRAFDDSQRSLLVCALDWIIPPEGEFPGAGELGLADHLDGVVSASANLKDLFAYGLAQIETSCLELTNTDFRSLPDAQGDVVLRDVEARSPEFFRELVRHTYNGYYTNSRVAELLGPDVRPPQPRGYHLEPGDLSSLEHVRKRGRIYREV